MPQRVRIAPIIRTVFAVSILLLLVMLGLAWLTSRAVVSAVRGEREGDQVLTELAHAREQLRDAQRAQRGWLLTGQDDHLADYARAQALARATMGRLRAAVAGDTLARGPVAGADTLVETAIAFFDSTIALRRTAGEAAARAVVATRRGEALVVAATARLDEAGAATRARTAAGQEGALAGARATTRMTAVAGLLTVVLVTLAALVIERELADRRDAQLLLRASEERYRLLFEHNPLPSWVFDLATLRFLAVNEAAVARYGWTREEFLGGLTLRDLRAPDEQAELETYLRHVRAGPTEGVRVRHRTAGGAPLDVEITSHTMEFAGREARLVVAHDVTERRLHEAALEASERRLRGEAERLAALVATQQAVATGGQDPQELMEIVAARAAAIAGADGALVAVPEPGHAGTPALRVRAAAGVHPGRAGERLPVTPVLERCLRENVTVASADCADDAALAEALGCRSLVALPLWDGAETTGLLVVTHRAPGRFGEREEQTLQLLTALASATLSRAEASAAREAALRRLEESEARYGSVVAALHEGVALVGADGTIRAVNASAERILGRAADTLVGLDLLRAGFPVLREDGTPMPQEELPPIRALLDGRPVSGVVLGFDRPDGHRVWLSTSSEPLRRDGEALPYAAVVSFTDITERKASDAALRQALEAAEGANRAKSVFLTTMSHELRTPLNSVIGFASLLLKNKQGTLREQELVYLRRIVENGHHLLGLINDLLDLSRIEAGRVELQLRPVALDRLVAETLEFLEPQARARDLELTADVPPDLEPVEADAARLRQILLNLAGNALKFTEQGGVHLRVAADPATRRPLRLDVVDTGIGIPADRLEAIFERFQQVDGTTERRYGGTGLGLAISRQLARLMGFRLSVQSTVGRGSTFSLHFGDPGA